MDFASATRPDAQCAQTLSLGSQLRLYWGTKGRREERSSEALGQLNFLELLLLQDEAQLRNEDADHERHDVVDAVHVLKDDVALILTEAADVRVGGQLHVLGDLVTDLNDDVGTSEDLLGVSRAILLLDSDNLLLDVALDGFHGARLWGQEDVVVAD